MEPCSTGASKYDVQVSGRLGFRLRQVAHDLGSGLLFRPAATTAALALSALALVSLERADVLARWTGGGWFFANDPGSAQAVLSAIAGSMMSVVSIVYSVLVVALSLASVQFSPRILGSFLRDRVSQRTLGVFIGTFVYCLLVMRAMSGDPPWVPTWATAMGMVLGVACIGFLIYFIHHIATNIQVANIVDRIAGETYQVIDEVYPPRADPRGPEAPTPATAPADARPVMARGSGYLQLVDHEGLAELARAHALQIFISVEPGDFVARGAELARVTAASAAAPPSAAELPSALAARIAGAFDLGPTRTMQQDVGFGLRQLVDIALKAISPAVNDPSTATICVDRLGSLLAHLAPRRPGARVLRDGEALRVLAPQPTFADLTDLAFNQLRQYGRADLAVSIRILHALGLAARTCVAPQDRARLSHHADLLRAGLAESFLEADRARFELAFSELASLLRAAEVAS